MRIFILLCGIIKINLANIIIRPVTMYGLVFAPGKCLVYRVLSRN